MCLRLLMLFVGVPLLLIVPSTFHCAPALLFLGVPSSVIVPQCLFWRRNSYGPGEGAGVTRLVMSLERVGRDRLDLVGRDKGVCPRRRGARSKAEYVGRFHGTKHQQVSVDMSISHM